MLLLPASSVNAPAFTSMEVAPCPEGVKVAEYDVPLPLKFEIVPPLTVMSLDAKFVVLSDVVNVKAIELSSEASPSLTVEDSVITEGATLSDIK